MDNLQHFINYSKFIRNYLFYWIKTSQTLPIVCFKDVEVIYIKRFLSFLSHTTYNIEEQHNIHIPSIHFPYTCEETHSSTTCIPHKHIFYTLPPTETIHTIRYVIIPSSNIQITDEQETLIQNADHFEEMYFNSFMFHDITDQDFHNLNYYSKFPKHVNTLYRKLYATIEEYPHTTTIRNHLTIKHINNIYNKTTSISPPIIHISILSFQIQWTTVEKELDDTQTETLHNPIISFMSDYFSDITYKITYYKSICRTMIHFEKDTISETSAAIKKKYETQLFLEHFKDFLETIPNCHYTFFN